MCWRLWCLCPWQSCLLWTLPSCHRSSWDERTPDIHYHMFKSGNKEQAAAHLWRLSTTHEGQELQSLFTCWAERGAGKAQGYPKGTGKQKAAVSSCCFSLHGTTKHFVRGSTVPALSSADLSAFSTLISASLLTESHRKLAAYAHMTWTSFRGVHPSGFIFIPKTHFSLSDLLQIFMRERTGQCSTVTAGIHHPTVLFCNARTKQLTVTKM